MAGYSATPLARKLSLKEGLRAWWPAMPASVRAEIDAASLSLIHLSAPEPPVEAAHVFVTRRAELEAAVAELRPVLAPAGFLWVSWPKKSSGLASEVNEDDIRRIGLPTGLVDIKVCAVDETWSGLKLVIRRDLR
ncbi:DUF3052 domain-containing protein [Phenylobacterium sp.]|uniref:DUF3052 domain-containing protein n=1 Tax=Phenylobacterium sp. TaxID=1871053 RepID=UPI00120DD409|nr:DUF3052 domain-containing protein [Phenylobacterium sp.]THD58868.1 MAG: DUF3052 family protein [Phenylobacterium sp.]